MKRPSFQFYPADWRSNTNLRRCSLAARGAWVDVICALHDSDEYGVIRWPLAEIASVAGVPLDLIKELVAKNVLKGSDGAVEAFAHTTRHAGKDGGTHVLIAANPGPCWFSSRMVVDEFRRNASGGSTRFGSPDRTPSQRQGERQGEAPDQQPCQRQGHGATSSSPSPSPSSVSSTNTINHTPLPPASGGRVTLREVLRSPPSDTESQLTEPDRQSLATARRAAKLFTSRRATTPWNKHELRAWESNRAVIEDTTPEEWADLEKWFSLREAPFRRQGLAQLLNNWQDEIFRCRQPENLQLMSQDQAAIDFSLKLRSAF